MGNSNTKEADEEPPVSGVQVTAGLVRQLEGRSPPDTQAKPVRRAGPAWLPHLRSTGPPSSSEFANAANGQGSSHSQAAPAAAQRSAQHDYSAHSMQDAKDQIQQQAQSRETKAEAASQQEVNQYADQLVKEYEVALKALPCQDEKTECLLCYQSNQQNPLRCAAQVDAFTKCARKASAGMVK